MNIASSCTIQRTRNNLLDIWRYCLTGDRKADPHEGVYDELSRFFGLSLERTRWLCKHSAEVVSEEWRRTGQSTPDELYRFYQAQTYWLFGTLRSHADQTQPQLAHAAVEIAHALQDVPPGHHLDFGCGAGTASLFFNALGWQTSLTDVSETAVSFAHWRFDQRGTRGTFYNLETDQLPPNTYDLITAFDVMVHVANIPAVLQRLHQSLKPNGYLVFNIVSRNPTSPTTSQWHLYDAHYPVIRHVRQVGFSRLPKIRSYYCYQKSDRSRLNASAVGVFDLLRHNRLETAVFGSTRRLLSFTKKTFLKTVRGIQKDP